MVNINDFKLYTEYLSNKVQVGNTLTIPQFNQLCFQSVMQVFEKDYQTFLMTEELSEFLRIYLKNQVSSVPATGILPYPADYQHITSIRKYYVNAKGVGKMLQVEEIKNVEWGFIQMSSLREPTLRFPKYNEFDGVIRFLPMNLGIIEIDYIKTPDQPVWGYTTVSGRPVYDPLTSTNFEFQAYSTNMVAAVFLSLVGVNLKDSELESFAQQYKKETNSAL
jgi:hypothetical protein